MDRHWVWKSASLQAGQKAHQLADWKALQWGGCSVAMWAMSLEYSLVRYWAEKLVVQRAQHSAKWSAQSSDERTAFQWAAQKDGWTATKLVARLALCSADLWVACSASKQAVD